MSTTAAQVAEAVKTALNAGTFSKTFTAIRVYLPMEALENLNSLMIVVAPKSDEWTGPAARGLRQNDIAIDIGIFQRLSAGTDPTAATANTEIDALVAFVKELAGSFVPGTLGSLGTGINWVRTANEPIYDPERLKSDNLFASLVTVTYRETSSL